MNATEPKLVEIEPGQEIIILIDGKPVAVVMSNPPSVYTEYNKFTDAYERYPSYEFVGAGITEGLGWESTRYLSGFASTGAIKLQEQSVTDVREYLELRK